MGELRKSTNMSQTRPEHDAQSMGQCMENTILLRTIIRSRPGTASKRDAAAGPQAMVTLSVGFSRISRSSNPVERMASPTRVEEMKSSLMAAFIRPAQGNAKKTALAKNDLLPQIFHGAKQGKRKRTMTDLDTETSYALLENRGVILLQGEDARDFLQGLVSNDVRNIAPDRAIHSAFLTPQGKYLFDFFMCELGGAIALDCEAGRRADFIKKLRMYKLRSKVDLTDRTGDLAVFSVFGNEAAEALGLSSNAGAARPFAGGVVFTDPRLSGAGLRAILPKDGAEKALEAAGLGKGSLSEYERLRIGLGLPDGSRDMVPEKALLLENGFDELNGVDWEKGCYMGQELTARTKYRGLVKKRLLPVEITGPTPPPGAPVMVEGREAGEMKSAVEGLGLALLRLEYLESHGPLTCGDATLKPLKPGWAA